MLGPIRRPRLRCAQLVTTLRSGFFKFRASSSDAAEAWVSALRAELSAPTPSDAQSARRKPPATPADSRPSPLATHNLAAATGGSGRPP